MKTFRSVLILCLLATALVSCKNKKGSQSSENPQPEMDALTELISKYSNGQVEVCSLAGQLYYKCSRNAQDGGSEIFSELGEKLGGCYYNTGAVDELCEKLSDCQAVYRVEPNIWGKPGIKVE